MISRTFSEMKHQVCLAQFQDSYSRNYSSTEEGLVTENVLLIITNKPNLQKGFIYSERKKRERGGRTGAICKHGVNRGEISCARALATFRNLERLVFCSSLAAVARFALL